MDDRHKKLEFIHKMAKLGLEKFDGGGVVGGGGAGGILPDISGALTTQNTYQATSPTSAGTIAGQQAGLAGQLETEASGAGPNPAQIQYQQNANAIAQQAAARNAQNRALNPGLAARLSGNEAVTAEQTAAGTAAAQQAQQQLAAQGELGNLTGQEQQGLESAQGINAQVGQNNANAVNNTEGGLVSGIGSGVTALAGGFGLAKGGPVKMAAGGTIVTPDAPTFSNASQFDSDHKQAAAAGSSAGKWLSGAISPGIGGTTVGGPALAGGAADAGGVAELAPLALAAKGGKVDPKDPKEKATVKGDSYDNDKVPALLSQGEFVLDRETMQDKGPMGQMARTLAKHIQAKNGKKKAA